MIPFHYIFWFARAFLLVYCLLFLFCRETQYSPEELLAMQLEKAKQYAETFADQPVKDAVITVPAYFTQAERRAVLMAAELGGLNVLQIMGDNAAGLFIS